MRMPKRVDTGPAWPEWVWLPLLGAAVLLWRILAIEHAGISLYVDEAQYWGWSKALDWGYFSKPPGIAALIAASTALFGDGVIGSKLLAMACYPLSAWLAGSIARRLYGPTVAGWSAVVVLSLPIYAWLGLFATTDALLVLAWTAAIRLYLLALDSRHSGPWLAFGAVCGLGLLSKYTMLVCLLSALLHLLLGERQRLRRPGPWLAALLAASFAQPNLLWNIDQNFPTFRHTAEITLQRQAGGLLSLLAFVGAQWAAFGPLFGSALIPAMKRDADDAARFGQRLLLCFALPLWSIASLQAAAGSANANWAAPAFVPATILVVAWLVRREHRRWLIAGLAFNLALTATLYHWPAWAPRLLPKTPSPYARALGWTELAAPLRAELETHPHTPLIAEDRTLLAHLQYELRDRALEIASWNPEGKRNDHYKLSTDFGRRLGSDAFYLADAELPAGIARRFADRRRLESIDVAADGRTLRRYTLYLLQDFQGY